MEPEIDGIVVDCVDKACVPRFLVDAFLELDALADRDSVATVPLAGIAGGIRLGESVLEIEVSAERCDPKGRGKVKLPISRDKVEVLDGVPNALGDRTRMIDRGGGKHEDKLVTAKSDDGVGGTDMTGDKVRD